jgi:uncharacterized membrane protein
VAPKTYPKARMEALCDGIFEVEMTLLALDVRFPDNFNPATSAELLDGVSALFPKFLPYALSFWVLGLRWLAMIRVRNSEEFFPSEYGKWLLLYLFLVTCVPFTTIAVGRFVSLPPAIWLYAGNTAALAIVGMMLAHGTPGARGDESISGRYVSLAILLISSLIVVALSFVSPSRALWALGLNVFAPWASRFFARE